MSDVNPIDWTKPIQTVDGLPARVICTDRRSRACGLTHIVLIDEGDEYPHTVRPDGAINDHGKPWIINVPPKMVEREEWRIRCEDGRLLIESYPSAEAAQARIDSYRRPDAYLPVRITWQEPESAPETTRPETFEVDRAKAEARNDALADALLFASDVAEEASAKSLGIRTALSFAHQRPKTSIGLATLFRVKRRILIACKPRTPGCGMS